MRTRYFAYVVLLAMLVPLAVQLGGCTTTEREGERLENQPPRVWLSSAPPEGTTETYTIRMFWGGWDPDGEISHYEYRITNNEGGTFISADTVGVWDKVYGNDSTFTFSADQEADSTNETDTVAEFTRSHTFFIRAVDEEGLGSLEPVHRSFTARTLSPRIIIDIPQVNGLNAASVPPITTFRWTATDFISDGQSQQPPESTQYALVSTAEFDGFWGKTTDYLRKDPDVLLEYDRTEEESDAEWSDWIFYEAPQDSGKFWTTPPLDFGGYIYAMRALDEAGAITPVLDDVQNVRRVRVSGRTTGPLFTVFNEFLGSVNTSTCKTPVTIVDLPASVPVTFKFNADASSYGGLVSGYRYGWDITDLNDDSQWEIDFTPFVGTSAWSPVRTFGFGTHVFTVEVVDNSGFCSRVQIKINYVQFTMNKNLMLVDDFAERRTSWNDTPGVGVLPGDAQHDQFWANALSGVAGFNPAVDQIEVTGSSTIPLTMVANYKSIVWSVFGSHGQIQDLPLLYQYIQYRPKDPPSQGSGGGKTQPNLLALFMAAGGHVFLSGNHPVQNNINRQYAAAARYPFMFLYDQDGNQDRTPLVGDPPGDESFGYKELCLETVDYSISTVRLRRTSQEDQVCPVNTLRLGDNNTNRDDGMRSLQPIDMNFPSAELRMEAAGPGRYYRPDNLSYDAEVYNPQYFFDSCIYATQSRNCFEPIYGLVCFDTNEPTYMQPIAFWTSVFADRVPDGGVGARSVVFGFAPVMMVPAEIQPAIDYILHDEWQLPRLQ